MHNAIAATLVRLTTRSPLDDPKYTLAARRMAVAMIQQYDDINARIARGENVGVYREAVS